MVFQGYHVVVGDHVFDVSATRGPGVVTNVTDSSLEVVFGNITVVYDNTGIQRGKNRRTLYWRDPVIVVPLKSEAKWSKLVAAVNAVREAML